MAAAKRKRVDDVESALSALRNRVETQFVSTNERLTSLEKELQELAGNIAAIRNLVKELSAQAPATSAPRQSSADAPISPERRVQLKALIEHKFYLSERPGYELFSSLGTEVNEKWERYWEYYNTHYTAQAALLTSRNEQKFVGQELAKRLRNMKSTIRSAAAREMHVRNQAVMDADGISLAAILCDTVHSSDEVVKGVAERVHEQMFHRYLVGYAANITQEMRVASLDAVTTLVREEISKLTKGQRPAQNSEAAA